MDGSGPIKDVETARKDLFGILSNIDDDFHCDDGIRQKLLNSAVQLAKKFPDLGKEYAPIIDTYRKEYSLQ
ncbi:hypothetical protein COV19_03145 [Candidatus Woesearchaeota archaeon CG10_big_fil_rev_8_21_14_0_10_44_13]|nr:MAG: hypothetical protein COV19_03145 [Candidatus Woesearchaeota archaeon CG10_big_fil_rev_8_21_14_0_10_44_13]